MSTAASTTSVITDEQIEAAAQRYKTTAWIGARQCLTIPSYQKFARDVLALAAPAAPNQEVRLWVSPEQVYAHKDLPPELPEAGRYLPCRRTPGGKFTLPLFESPEYERYRKLRGWMSSNVKEGWEEVEKLGAVAAWMSWDDFDQYLDGLPECNVGLMQKPLNPMKEIPE